MNALRQSQHRRLLIAPGYRRCGTTSLQALLRTNSELLRPYFSIHSRDDLTHRWRVHVRRHSRKNKKLEFDRLRRYAQQIAETIDWGPSGNAVIADENLIGYTLLQDSGDTLFDTASKVLPILEDVLTDVEITFWFQYRNWDDWLWSNYSRDVTRYQVTYSFEQFKARIPKDLSWETGKQTIQKALSSPTMFVDIKDDRIQGMPGRSILDFFDVPSTVIERLELPDRHHVSKPPWRIEVNRYLNILRNGVKRVLPTRQM